MSSPGPTVVYVSLGTRRVSAAQRHSADLAAAGERVLLVVAEAADLEPVAGVTVHRLGAGPLDVLLRAARRLLLRSSGPLAGARLFIAGDVEATPIADAVRRRFREVEVRLEPSADPDRRPAPADLAVLTPWYPSPNDPFAGAFVEATTATVADGKWQISILQNENWFYPAGDSTGNLLRVTARREMQRAGGVVVTDTPIGELTRVVTPQTTRADYAARTRAQIARLRAALPSGRIEAPLIHAHTGHYAGVVATALAREDAKIVVTEHVTFLAKVLAQPGSRRQYGEMVKRADRILCVGRALLDQLSAAYPAYVDKFQVVPNPVDFDRFEFRAEAPAEPLRLLYAGRMLKHKGVHTLLEAFAEIAREEPRATLTLVGNGPLEEELTARIAELGLGERVTQRPPVPPEEVSALMREHDLLVHPSVRETFGLTVVEAVASGTPVLVAASEGPAETLADLDGVAGALFPVTQEPADIVEAYRALRARWSELDLAAARDVLAGRYSREAVGERLRAVYAEVLAEERVIETPAAPAAEPEKFPAPEPGAERIAVVAIEPPGNRNTRNFIKAARAQGYGVDLIAVEPKRWPWYADDEGVRVYGVGGREDRRFGRRLERVLVNTLPRRVIGFLRSRASRMASPTPEAVAMRVANRHRSFAKSFERRMYQPWYRVVRPRILGRIARREVLPKLDQKRIRQVVVHGPLGTTIGWELAKRLPDAPVTTDLTPPGERAKVR
ncbi:glycosyltransferase [Actinoplanes sp. NPDC024001]|uniref:glycosyltransferase n=1 Tax=Actinoplanes sp. NPDC024001 TaxID=3154598 RepID=UPI0033C00AD2